MKSQEPSVIILTVFRLCEHISKSPSFCELVPCCGRLGFVPETRGEQGRLGLRAADVNWVR